MALVKSAKGTSALATTTASFASATTAGNLIVLAFAADDYNGTPGTGWTQSTGMEQQTFHGGYLWWRISTGETNFSYTIGSAANSAWVIAEFSAVDATPYDISNGQFVQAGGSSPYTTPSIVPSTGNRLLVAFMGASLSSSLSGQTWGSWVNSFTAIDSIGSGGAGTNDLAGLAYRLVTGDGSTGYSSGATASTATQSRSGLIIAFKEAAAGGTAYTLTAAQGTFALSGKAATLRQARKLVAATGARALTGVSANLKRGLKLPAAAGSFSLSGVAAGFRRTYAIGAAAGSFSLSGQNANLSFGHRLTASAAAFSLSGQAAVLRAGRKIISGSGTFSLTGVDASLVYASVGTHYTLTAATGTFTLSGQSSALKLSRVVGGGQGEFALAGQAAGLRVGRKVAASQGQFNLTGFDAGLTYEAAAGYTLAAEAAVFSLTGLPVDLSITRVPAVINVGGGGGGGYSGSFEHHHKREKEKRKDREELREAINRAVARLERNEDLTSEQVEEAEEAIEKVEAAVEVIPAPDLSPLIELLDNIGKKISSIEQDRAIERLKDFEDEMADEDAAIEALMMVA